LKANDNYGGVNIKAFIDKLNAVEVTIHADVSGARGVILLYKRQNKLGKYKQLYWFFGGGPQLGLWRNTSDQLKARLGLDAVTGLEYVVPKFPLAFAVEYIPGYVFVSGGNKLELSNYTLAIRYVFKNRQYLYY
jgi:hypothetical protein